MVFSIIIIIFFFVHRNLIKLNARKHVWLVLGFLDFWPLFPLPKIWSMFILLRKVGINISQSSYLCIFKTSWN